MEWEILLWSFIVVTGLFGLFLIPWWFPILWSKKHVLTYPLLLIPLKRQSMVGLLVKSMPNKWFILDTSARNDELKITIYADEWDRISIRDGDWHQPTIHPNIHEKVHILYALRKYNRRAVSRQQHESLLKLAGRIVEVYSDE